MRFYAAASTVDDDILEMSGESFGAPYGENGFGTSDVLKELMSRDPKYVPISDLVTYQQGLVDTGYLPPDYVPTGNWDDLSNAASRRADRDSFNTARGGGSFLAAGPKTLFRYLGYTVPTPVFEGLYGIAQGIVSDAVRAATNPVEVFEEGGLAGGAIAGAGIGGAVGLLGGPLAPVTSGIGALVGGAVGGVAGFFGDFFDDDEDEGGTWQRIVGALSPIDEIKSGDAKNLFAALSTIMTASAFLKAAKVGVAGVQAATAGPQGARVLTMREGYKMAARDAVTPGLLNQFTQAALKRKVMGSAVLGGAVNAAPELLQGDFGQAVRDFGTGAVIGALAGPTVHRVGKKPIAALMKGLEAAPLARIAGAPAGRVTQALFTTATTPTIVARGIGELSQANLDAQAKAFGYESFTTLAEADQDLANRLRAESSSTAVMEDIQNAPDAGLAGDILDITFGAVIFPERLLPWRGKDVAKAFESMGSGHLMVPFAEHARRLKDGTVLSMSKGMERAKELMGFDPKSRGFSKLTLGVRVNDAYLQAGVAIEEDARIAQRIGDFTGADPYERMKAGFDEDKARAAIRSEIKAEVIAQADGKGDLASTPLGKQLIATATADPKKMQAYLAQHGYDLEYWADVQRAQESLNLAHRETFDIESLEIDVPTVSEQVARIEQEAAHLDELIASTPGRLATTDEEVGHIQARLQFFRQEKAALDKTLTQTTRRDPKYASLRAARSKMVRAIKQYESRAAERLGTERLRLRAEKYGVESRLQVMQEEAGSLQGRLKKAQSVSFQPAVKGEYITGQDLDRFGGKPLGKGEYQVGEYEEAATAYKRARDDLDTARDDAELEQLDMAVFDAGTQLEKTLSEMKTRGIIDQDIYDSLRPGGVKEPLVEKRLIKYLREAAAERPREVPELTERVADIAGGRYIAIATGENMIDYTHFLNQAEITGIAEYTRRRAFFDSLSAMGAQVDRMDIARLRYASIVTHLNNTAAKYLRDPDGKRVADAVYDYQKRRFDVEAAKRKGETLEIRGPIVRRETQGGDVSRQLFSIDPRDLTPEDYLQALNLEGRGVLKAGMDPYEAAHAFKRATHVGASFGADAAHPLHTARALLANLGVSGLPAVNDFVRTATVIPTKFALKGERFKKGSYGYLPQTLRRTHLALQFSLNPTFDISRYWEAMIFGKIRGGDIPLSAATSHKKFIRDFEGEQIDPMTLQPISGQEAVDASIRFGDLALYGRAMHKNFDEMQLQLMHRGVLGFKTREVEYTAAWWLAQRKARQGPLTQKDLDEIRETVMQITQYGSKQTALGNSAHFVFFPFLFSRKQLSAMIDFSLGAPGRNVLIHEGMRRWYGVSEYRLDELAEERGYETWDAFEKADQEAAGELRRNAPTMSEDFAKYAEKHIPLAQEVQRINSLAYGISPGRFFLEGIMDKDTEGKVAQALGSFLVPGGVHQPVADVLGNLFSPVVVTEENVNPALALAERLVPAYRDIDRWFMDEDVHGAKFGVVGAQLAPATLAGRGTPRVQMSEYLDSKRVMTTALETLATNAGFSSWESLRGSSPELAALADEIDNELGSQFPEGKRLSQEFTNRTEVKDQALYDIAQKPDQTEAEEAIGIIADIEARARAIADASDELTQEEVLRAFSPIIRDFALGFVNDRDFMNLWHGLGLISTYGPLRRIEVA